MLGTDFFQIDCSAINRIEYPKLFMSLHDVIHDPQQTTRQIDYTLAYVCLALLFIVRGLINCLDQNSQIRPLAAEETSPLPRQRITSIDHQCVGRARLWRRGRDVVVGGWVRYMVLGVVLGRDWGIV